MRKLVLLSSVFFVLQCAAQTVRSSLLWKISGNGIKKPSYVFGTMHLINEKYYRFSDTLKHLILTSDQLVMEIDKVPDYADVFSHLMLPEGESWSDIYNPEQLDTLKMILARDWGVSQSTFELSYGKMKPFALLQMLETAQMKGKSVSYDMNIMKLANENNLPTVGFETAIQQLSFFDSLPQQKIAEWIYHTVLHKEQTIHEMEQMERTYSLRNLDSLQQFMKQNPEEMKGFEDVLIYNRNANWVTQVNKYFKKKQQYFIAVGAGHLPGDKGLIQLLRNEGYELTPMPY